MENNSAKKKPSLCDNKLICNTFFDSGRVLIDEMEDSVFANVNIYNERAELEGSYSYSLFLHANP